MDFRSPAPIALVALLAACGGGIQGPLYGDGDTGDVSGPPNLFVQAEFVDFGEVELGDVETANLTVRNTGAGDLEITETSFDNNVFGTSGIPSVIPAGGNAVVNLTFLPTDYGSYEGTMTILSNDADDSSFTLSLRGRVISDADGDGYDSLDAGGDDCDDEDPDINPGAADLWYDGKDTNCDGADDYDQDGDGFQTDIYNPDADGGGGDCQDANPAIFPGAEDTWYDGIDSDCNGSNDYDRDGDGWMHPSGGGADCDDEDANKNPDGVEMFNGIDDNCDGDIDNDVSPIDADLHYYGVVDGDRLGTGVTVGDLDDDGYAELIVGAQTYSTGRGGVAIFDGSSMPADGSTLEDANNYFRGDGSTDALGYFVGYLGEFGSGGAHLMVGGPGANGNYGAMFVIPGADARSGGDTADAIVAVNGSSSAYYVGRAAAENLDLDGDGLNDLFGFYATSTSTTADAYQYLLYGDASGSYTVDTTDARFYAPGGAQVVQRMMPGGGDLDGDGYDDALYCDHFADIGATNDGGVWALWGGATRHSNTTATSLATAGTRVSSGDNYERHGWQCAIGPDMDGDGDGELWVHNPGRETLYVIPGGTDFRTADLDGPTYASHEYRVSTSNPWPDGIRAIGDWDGDGISEVAAGMRAAPNTTGTGGQIWVFSSEQPAGEYSVNQIYSQIEGDDELGNQLYGLEIPGSYGDINGDGRVDFVATDSGFDEVDSSGASVRTNIGATWVSYGLF